MKQTKPGDWEGAAQGAAGALSPVLQAAQARLEQRRAAELSPGGLQPLGAGAAAAVGGVQTRAASGGAGAALAACVGCGALQRVESCTCFSSRLPRHGRAREGAVARNRESVRARQVRPAAIATLGGFLRESGLARGASSAQKWRATPRPMQRMLARAAAVLAELLDRQSVNEGPDAFGGWNIGDAAAALECEPADVRAAFDYLQCSGWIIPYPRKPGRWHIPLLRPPVALRAVAKEQLAAVVQLLRGYAGGGVWRIETLRRGLGLALRADVYSVEGARGKQNRPLDFAPQSSGEYRALQRLLQSGILGVVRAAARGVRRLFELACAPFAKKRPVQGGAADVSGPVDSAGPAFKPARAPPISAPA